MTVLAIVLVAGILLTWMLVHSYSGRDATPFKRQARRARTGDGGDVSWMYFGGGSDGGGASDCGGSDGGGSDGGGCGGDGGGGGGGGD